MQGGIHLHPESERMILQRRPDDIADDAVKHLVGCSREMAEGRLESVCWFEVPSVFIVCEREQGASTCRCGVGHRDRPGTLGHCKTGCKP